LALRRKFTVSIISKLTLQVATVKYKECWGPYL